MIKSAAVLSRYKFKLIALFLLCLSMFIYFFYFNFNHIFVKQNILDKVVANDVVKDVSLKLLFTGDIFLGRNVRSKSLNSNFIGDEKYKYPFQKLNTLNKEKYDAWIGNLECPVTDGKVDYRDEHVYLKFNCDKKFLPEMRKYFDILSLANNHTDNMDGQKGLDETRENLKINNFQYFGHFDNAVKQDICEIVNIKSKESEVSMPIAMCGYHGVFKLPKQDEINVIKEYSKYFVTIVMPHQGMEYEPRSGTYQKSIYIKFIDAGADVVIGAHPHVTQEIEEYKGKLIFYSLGNFIFDQTGQVTRRHFVVDTEVNFKNIDLNLYNKFKCESYKDDCLVKAKELNFIKSEFKIKYDVIPTENNLEFITQKRNFDKLNTKKDMQFFYNSILWDKINKKYKIN